MVVYLHFMSESFLKMEEKIMKMFKSIFCSCMAFVMIATVFCGCGGKEGPNTETLKNEFVDEGYLDSDWLAERKEYEKENSPYNIPENLKGTKVVFASWIDPMTDESAHSWSTFEEKTGIKLEYLQIGQSEYNTKIASLIASGDAPDIFIENMDTFPSSLSLVQPLNKISTIDLNDPIWDKSMSDFGTFGGNTYFINTKYSIWSGGDLVYYNKKALEDNGILTPQDYIDAGEWTLENLFKIAREFTSLNSAYGGIGLEWRYLAAASGSALAQIKDGKFVSGINDAAMLDSLRQFYIARDEKLTVANANKGLMAGTNAFVIVGAYGLKKTGYYSGMKDPENLGFAPIPSLDGKSENSYNSAIYRSYGICRGAKNAEGAGYFLRYYLDPLNYDYDEAFISEDARDFYLEYISAVDAKNKVFDFTTSVANAIGYKGDNWRNSIQNSNGDQYTVALQSISNEVQAGVDAANKLINDVIARDK